MATDVLATVKTAEVCQRFKLSDEGAKLFKPDLPPRKFLDTLIEKQHFLDAIRFLAYALPKREAVWWACACARQVCNGKEPAPFTAALTAAEKWVADPSEDNRRAAMPAAEKAELATPAGCAAMAAFWSGGSLAPPQNPVVPPADHLTGHGAASSILLSAVRSEPEKASEKYKKFLATGLDVARGANRWK